MQLPACPKCHCEYTYEDGEMIICPECAYEWSKNSIRRSQYTLSKMLMEQFLADGDTKAIKDLNSKASAVIKGGTKVKTPVLILRVTNLDCKVDGIGAMGLKSEFVKKA